MQAEDFDNFLLDLRPEDVETDLNAKMSAMPTSDPAFQKALDRELRYLKMISSMRVDLPDERYFAETRQRIFRRIGTEKESWSRRLMGYLRPVWERPVPRFVAGAIVTAALLITFVRIPSRHVEVSAVAYGPPAPIGAVYDQQIASLSTAEQIRSVVRERSDLLLRAASILSSPSSLSRSTLFIRGGK